MDIEHAFSYHSPNYEQTELMNSVRASLLTIARFVEQHVSASAERTIALRKLHEASMAINYAIIADPRHS